MSAGINGDLSQKLVYIVDDDLDHLQMISAMVKQIGYTTKTFKSGTELLDCESIDEADCVLLDNQMPVISGLEIQAILNQRHFTTPILFMSGASAYADVVDAVTHGAVNFLQKPIGIKILEEQIGKAIEDGRLRIDKQKSSDRQQQLLQCLTAREHDIYDLLVTGHTNKMISSNLGISVSTVEFHRRNLMRKLGAKKLVDLIKLA